jgi:hypothetical protein
VVEKKSKNLANEMRKKFFTPEGLGYKFKV